MSHVCPYISKQVFRQDPGLVQKHWHALEAIALRLEAIAIRCKSTSMLKHETCS